MHSTTLLTCLAVVLAPGSTAQVLPTDAQPRQQAVVIEGCGEVHFPIRCHLPENQRYFDLGMAHLHAHAWLEAERYFRQVTKTEPDIAMAYWGMAMANFAAPQRAADLTEQALLHRAKATDRQKKWIDALARYYEVTLETAQASRAIKKKEGAYAELPKRTWKQPVKTRARAFVAALEQLVKEEQKDHDAKLILVDQLCRNRELGLPIEDVRAAGALVAEVMKASPQHVGRYTEMRLGTSKAHLESVVVTPRPASAIPEYWHMEGRLYARRQLHTHAVHYFDIARRCWHTRMTRHRMMPYRTADYAVLMRDLCDSLMSLGNHRRVIELATWMARLARHPRYNQQGNPDHLAGLGALYVIRSCGLHDDAKRLTEWEDAGRLSAGRHRQGRVRFAAELGLAYARLGVRDRSERWSKRVRALRADAWPARDANKIDEWIAQLAVWQAVFEGREDDARRGLESCRMSAADRARCQDRLGDRTTALASVETAIRRAPSHAATRVLQVSLLHRYGEKEGAREALRTWNLAVVSEAPETLAKLAPILKELDLDPDSWWRRPDPDPAESSHLDTFGPKTWQPVQAHDWNLLDIDGKPFPFSKYAGKPVVVILYLGFGCVHCVEQLGEFQPHARAFKKAGLDILAIGTDTAKNIREAMAGLPADERFAFTMLSDRKMRVFREWVAYDFFGELPMHGTFLVDGDGKVLFQDISHEPFMYPEWFLAECKRLLR